MPAARIAWRYLSRAASTGWSKLSAINARRRFINRFLNWIGCRANERRHAGLFDAENSLNMDMATMPPPSASSIACIQERPLGAFLRGLARSLAAAGVAKSRAGSDLNSTVGASLAATIAAAFVGAVFV